MIHSSSSKNHKDCKTTKLLICKNAKIQICKNTNLQKLKICKIAKTTNDKKNTIIIKRGQMQKFIIFSSSRRHQTLSYRGSNRETGSQNPTKSPSNVPDAHLLTPSPASPIVIATKLWISQSVLSGQSVNQFLSGQSGLEEELILCKSSLLTSISELEISSIATFWENSTTLKRPILL